MATIVTNLTCELTGAVQVKVLQGNLFSADNAGNTINVFVTNHGQPATLGGTISANVIRGDGTTVAVSGAIDGNRAYIILPQACYAVPGVIQIIIKNTESSTVTTIAAVVANVYESTTDTVVDPGNIIPSVAALVEAIEDAVAEIPAGYNACFAPAYSTSSTYALGQYVTYSGYLYRCTTAITSSESWTAAHWTQVALANDVSALKSAIIEMAEDLDFVGNYGLVIVRPELEKGWIDTSGQNSDNANTLRTAGYISVDKPYYYIHHLANYSIAIRVYDSSKNYLRSVYSTGGDTIIVMANTEKYLRYCLNNTTSDYVEDPVTKDCGFISYKGDAIAKIEEDILDFDKDISKVSTIFIEDYSDKTSTFGTISTGYIKRDDGSFVSYADCEATDYIPIDDLKGYFITAKAKYSVAIYAVYSSKSVSSFLTAFDRGAESELLVYRYAFPYWDIIKNYPNAKYVRLSSIEEPLTIEDGIYADKPSVVTANPLYGKRIIAIGDSMVKGHTLSESKVWLTLIANRNNMAYVNYGANGRQIANVATPYHDASYSVYANYASMTNDADIIILFAGTNDSNYNLPVGTYDSTDVTTVCGALNAIFAGMQTKYPDKLIVVFTPYERSTPPGNDSIYAEAIETVAHKYGIPVFNNVKNGGISWNNTTQTNMLCLDSTHLNATGQEFASKRYEGFIRSLM